MTRLPQATEATYQDSVLRLDQPLALDEQQRVWVMVMPLPESPLREALPPDELLRLAAQVYEGLTTADVEEVEQIALDRSRFFTDPA